MGKAHAEAPGGHAARGAPTASIPRVAISYDLRSMHDVLIRRAARGRVRRPRRTGPSSAGGRTTRAGTRGSTTRGASSPRTRTGSSSDASTGSPSPRSRSSTTVRTTRSSAGTWSARTCGDVATAWPPGRPHRPTREAGPSAWTGSSPSRTTTAGRGSRPPTAPSATPASCRPAGRRAYGRSGPGTTRPSRRTTARATRPTVRASWSAG